MSRKSKDKSAKVTSKANISEAPEVKKDTSPLVPQRDKINWELSIRERDDLTEKQKKYLDIILDKNTKIVFLSGPAGTSKTFLAIYAGLIMLNKRSVSDITYIRSVIESASRSLGSLPGDEKLKMEPYVRPLVDKMEEMLGKADIDKLTKENRFEGMPVNYLRGASFNARFIVTDEAQNLDVKELTTVITRIGKFSKFVICGDPSQSDINGRSGFMKMYDLFNDETSKENGIHCLSFSKEDIVRSGILKYIAERLENSGQLLK
jgi:phosphate starvation-inducible protein PhoH and related proteins